MLKIHPWIFNTRRTLDEREQETITHLLIHCPLSKLLWWNFPWQFRIEALNSMNPDELIWYFSYPTDNTSQNIEEKKKMFQFLVIAFEQLWIERNKLWRGMKSSNWEDISTTTNKTFTRYWRSMQKKQRGQGLLIEAQLKEWQPPTAGELKINFDAAFKNGRTATGMVLQNSHSQILGAWVNHFRFENQKWPPKPSKSPPN